MILEFHSSVAFHIETSSLIWILNQITNSYMTWKTVLKWVNLYGTFNIFHYFPLFCIVCWKTMKSIEIKTVLRFVLWVCLGIWDHLVVTWYWRVDIFEDLLRNSEIKHHWDSRWTHLLPRWIQTFAVIIARKTIKQNIWSTMMIFA